MNITKFAVIILSVVFIAGCAQPSTSSSQSNNYTQSLYNPPENGTPSLQLITPRNGDIIGGTTVVGIKVNVTNFRLADSTANPVNKKNEGHIRYWLDERNQTTVYQIVSFTQVPFGTHTIRVELMNNDNTPLDSPVFAMVTITTRQ